MTVGKYLFMSPPKALTNFPAACGVPAPVSSTHAALGRGGEGAVYPLPAQPGLIAKLYTRPPQDYADKLAWMKAHPPDDPGLTASRSNTTALSPSQRDAEPSARDAVPSARDAGPSGIAHASIAWPLDLLYNPPGQFAGFIMPRITNASSLLGVFNPRTRARTSLTAAS